jgi:hypothetical protein
LGTPGVIWGLAVNEGIDDNYAHKEHNHQAYEYVDDSAYGAVISSEIRQFNWNSGFCVSEN